VDVGGKTPVSSDHDFGRAVSFADVNHDGFDDLIIGANASDPSGLTDAGDVFILYGRDTGVVTPVVAPVIRGTDDNDDIDGTRQDDIIDGAAGDDSLQGGGGDDVLIGGPGADRMNGQSGTDTASYTAATAGVTANLGTSANGTGDAAGDHFVQIENLTGSAFADALTGDAGANVIIGLAGDDTFYWSGGGDTFNGGDGNDTVSYAFATSGVNARLKAPYNTSGAAAGDTYQSIENIVGSQYADTLNGSHDANILIGLDGNDKLVGVQGADTLIGGRGDDTYSVDRPDDVCIELANEGTDTVVTEGSYQLSENIENLTVDSSATGVLNLRGNDLNNRIVGSGSDDRIRAFLGADDITGGAGNDTFVCRPGESTLTAMDWIRDFDATKDLFDIRKGVSGIDPLVEGNNLGQIATLLDGAHLQARHAVLLHTSADDRLYLAVDNDGVAGFVDGIDTIIQITGATHLDVLSLTNFI